jgi:prepilin-type N-terminal cleavage/methylation domain-containing protein
MAIEERGFTLIELLVVIAIIGLLATMAVVGFGGAQVKARDTKRMHDMKQIANALELYYDEYGHYPIPASTWASFDAPTYSGTAITNPAAADLTTALRIWLPGGAADPKRTANNGSGYLYRHLNSGADYCIMVFLTPENLNNYPQSYWNPTRCGGVDSDGICNVAGTVTGPLQSVILRTAAFVNGC